MNRIIRTLDKQEYGLCHRFIFGLSTLRLNRAVSFRLGSEETLFLSALGNQCEYSGQVGAISLEECGVTPEAVFGSQNANLPYLPTHIGFNQAFFDLNSLTVNNPRFVEGCTIRRVSTFGDSFVPRITSDFWRAINTIPGFFYSHGLVLYISPTDKFEQVTESMSRMLAGPFPGEERWLREVTRLYRMVLLLGHDGEYFHAWTRDTTHFALLDDPLSKAEASIRNSQWFQSNESRLVWSESPGLITVNVPISSIRNT